MNGKLSNWLRIPLSLLTAGMMAVAAAQSLPDPTQPPPESMSKASGAAVVEAPVTLGPQLQSVLIGANGRQVAVIDGQTLRQGEKFNGALLVKVSKDRVVLRRGTETQVLMLFPDADMTAKNMPPKH